MQQFIGRESWLKRFQDYLSQEQGVIWRITGQPGIGKSTLLGRFAGVCEQAESPNVWLDMEGFTPTHGLDFLATMAGSAHFFNTQKANKSFKEKAGEGFKTVTGGLVGALELAKDFIPGGGLAAGTAKVVVGLAEGVAGDAAQRSEKDAAAHPELYLLKALAEAGTAGTNKKPVCLVDTYEHVLRSDLQIKSRLAFAQGQARDAQERAVQFSIWLTELFEYLQSKGWRIVMVGRSIPRSQVLDNLPRFSRTEILEATKGRPSLSSYLPTQENALLTVLATLSFEGNPLWLQVAMNLLENLLAERKDLEQLAEQPDYLQACFEEENPLDIDSFDGIEHGSCKLGLINTMTHHIAGLEDQAWKIALPRVLDKGIVQQLFEPTQANAILHNFKIAGVFRVSGQQFSLHEEIRDLLLAYARSKGWLETAETRALHDKLWEYLNNFNFSKLPAELRSKINREGLRGGVEYLYALNKQLAAYFPSSALLEACYHRAMSLEKLPDETIDPMQLWQQLAGSASLSPLLKWRAMETLPDLSAFQVSELSVVFSDELRNWVAMFGEPTAQALWQAQLSGQANAMHDIEFWESRIREHGLVGDCYGFQQILNEHYPELSKRCQEVIDELWQRYGDSDVVGVQEPCAKALNNKGEKLGEKLNDPAGAIAVYDALVQRYGDSNVAGVQEQCATGLYGKGVTLGEKLNDPAGAIAVYDQLLQRYGDSRVDAVQELCARALHNKGGTLGRMGQLEQAIKCFDDLLVHYSQSENSAIKEQCQSALANSIEPLLVLGRKTEAAQRSKQLLEQVSKSDQEYAIMQFLLWLAGDNNNPHSVLKAIHELSPEVQFDWGWSDIRPFINKLPEPRKSIAECFISFFEQHRDVARLESELAQLQALE